jgi:hypothetical protein
MIFGCASSELTKFKKNTITMSDSELLSCYHGINERIKDIDNSIEREDPIDNSQLHDIISHQTYLAGGEAYGLMQKEKVVLEELRRRNIEP